MTNKKKFYQSSDLIKYYKRKRATARVGGMILKEVLDNYRDTKKIQSIIVSPIIKKCKENEVDHRALYKVLEKLNIKILDNSIEWNNKKWFEIQKKEVEVILKLFDLYKDYLKLDKKQKEIIYTIILYFSYL